MIDNADDKLMIYRLPFEYGGTFIEKNIMHNHLEIILSLSLYYQKNVYIV